MIFDVAGIMNKMPGKPRENERSTEPDDDGTVLY
jgi:hypothetical protein